MSSFYVSIIFIGITLIIISSLAIILDKNKSSINERQINEKKEELLGIISDAEQMVEELNKFSDYVIAQIESRNEELNTSLKNYEDRVKQINSEMVNISELKDYQNQRIAEKNSEKQPDNSEQMKQICTSDLVIDNIDIQSNNINNSQINYSIHKGRDKIMPLNSKHKEVLQLAVNGMDETEIAKRLNIGRGEIKLILDLNK